MKIDYDIAIEVASHEAIVRQAYKDSVGKWTWSVGLTSATGHKVERYIDNPQPLQKCLSVYIWALKRYAKDVEQAFAPINLTKPQFAAALSFHWNTGAIKKASWVKHFKNGDTTRAKEAFMNYRKPKEIIPRRRDERDLFFKGKWSNNGTMTEYTRLGSGHRPDWGSGRKVNVRPALEKIFSNTKQKVVGVVVVATGGLLATWWEQIKIWIGELISWAF